MSTLKIAQIAYCGAGQNATEAASPAVFQLPSLNSRVLIFAGGHSSSGIPSEWKATDNREGLNEFDIDNPSTAVSKLHKNIS